MRRSVLRVLFLIIGLAPFAGAAVACSSTPANGGTAGDAAACVVVASSYDQTCTKDSDCVAVPPGGNTCDPCHAGSGDFSCPLAAVNASVSARYQSSLALAFQSIVGTPTYDQCVVSSCPAGLGAVCDNGVCSVASTVTTGADAGDGATGK